MITLKHEKEYKDGSALYTFEITEEFRQLYLRETGKKRATEKGMGKYIVKLLTDYVNQFDK